MIDKKVMKIHFSRNAVNYDMYAKVQKKMASELLMSIGSKLPQTDSEIDILDIGCGTGYLTQKLLGHFKNAKITAVDIAPGMIEYAKEKFADQNVQFICADIEDVQIDKKFDLIISNATFQWFNQTDKTIAKLGSMLKHNGILAFSTFGDKTFTELYQSYKYAKDKLNLEFEALPGQEFLDSDKLLEICRTSLENNDVAYNINTIEKHEYEYFDTVKDFVKSVKRVGANNSNSNRKTNPALTREMINAYESMFKENGKIKATYHCIFTIIEISEQ